MKQYLRAITRRGERTEPVPRELEGGSFGQPETELALFERFKKLLGDSREAVFSINASQFRGKVTVRPNGTEGISVSFHHTGSALRSWGVSMFTIMRDNKVHLSVGCYGDPVNLSINSLLTRIYEQSLTRSLDQISAVAAEQNSGLESALNVAFPARRYGAAS